MHRHGVVKERGFLLQLRPHGRAVVFVFNDKGVQLATKLRHDRRRAQTVMQQLHCIRHPP